MHLTREIMDRWAERTRPGIHLLRLEDGDSAPVSSGARVAGPAVVDVVVFRHTTGWAARKVDYETPASLVAAGELP